MAYRQIIPIDDKLLTKPSAPIEFVNGEVPQDILDLAGDMLETCRAINGAGLAAVQVGEPVRLFVMDLAQIEGPTMIFINPEIIARSGETIEMLEGCLSMPGIAFKLERAASVTVRYTALDGEQKTFDAGGYAAICCQHEIDHLDGVRHIDHLSKLKRSRYMKKFDDIRMTRLGALHSRTL